MNVIVEVMGLELHGKHGVLDEERRDGQRFLFDLRLETAEPQDDRIEDAVDYREV
ncbi:MAG: dihydroneopterin aldolase, partial [Gaiellaceae bacterium]